MQIKALSVDECRATLRAASIGRLACVRYDRPYIVPISFDFLDDALYGFATSGRKIHWMRTNPRVCVEVDDIRDRFNWTTVVVEGRYEELTDVKEHEAARAQALRLFRARRHWQEPASAKLDPTRVRNPVVYRIQIEAMSGRHAFEDDALERLPRRPRVSRMRRWWKRAAHAVRRRPAVS
jgi:uncharacterized protein